MNEVAIGLDIGGTSIGLGVVGPGGAMLRRTAIATEPTRGFPDALVRIETAVREILRDSGHSPADLVGVGIGCAGPVDAARGTIHNLFSLIDWNDADIVSPLAERFGVPVWLENDADTAAFGEWHVDGSRARLGRLLMLTIGTGIGGGVVIDGEIYRGAGGEHPEIGHVLVADDGPPCFCGSPGCLESIASGTAIGRMGRDAGLGDSRDVFRATAAGDSAAARIVAQATRAVARGVWTLVHTFLPDVIMLGGGVADEHFELFAAPIRDALAPGRLFPRDRVQVVQATLGNAAGVVGAGLLAFDAAARQKSAPRRRAVE